MRVIKTIKIDNDDNNRNIMKLKNRLTSSFNLVKEIDYGHKKTWNL